MLDQRRRSVLRFQIAMMEKMSLNSSHRSPQAYLINCIHLILHMVYAATQVHVAHLIGFNLVLLFLTQTFLERGTAEGYTKS